MTREEWIAYAESTPATNNQFTTVAGHMERLGYTDRGERLAVTAALAGLDHLDSSRSLTMAQAGALVRLLMDCEDRGDLDALLPTAAEPRAPEPAVPRTSWAEVRLAIARALADLRDPSQIFAFRNP